ncbi:MAG: PIG-L family deacetylase [Alphaproteobacteria bacterium]|nr:PIG-L family deacetylase [Alphaproteobacteria bacterium]
MFGKRILILVAHPDDEAVAQAGSILRARADGAEIFALYLTNGCLARDVLWKWQRADYEKSVARRRAEGEEAARLLGLTPLGWSPRDARMLWRDLPEVMGEVERALAACKPDQVWVPAYEGGNPDHDALNAVGARLKTRLSVLEFAEYNNLGGTARAQSFISSDETTRIMELTSGERMAKREALAVYKSEQNNLGYIGLEQESYRPIAAYDYARPPHQGTLWYARFQWVPFRHPRVDFTDPADVSAAITSFLSRE